MTATLSLPAEPRALKRVARTLLEQAPETGLPLITAGGWIGDPLWERWQATLAARGMGREQFDRIVADYGNELRLGVVGERPWDQYASGLAGRVTRRLGPGAAPLAPASWQTALGRVGITPETSLAKLTARIEELHLLYEISGPTGVIRARRGKGPGPASATVWAGGRPRDPEAPTGVGESPTSAAEALAEALGKFLLKDPAYPPREAVLSDWVI